MFEESTVLITGGTGSFGHSFTERLLTKFGPQKLVIFSRDEMKQWQMAKKYEGDKRVRFFIGDVRDRDRVYRAFDGIDYVVHAAATKIVPTAEYNPFEAVKTNIGGAMNVIDAAVDQGVKKVVALSTDKASSPVNLYGATKLVSDKMFTAALAYAGAKKTNFSVVRYGNVMGSRGSVIPYFLELRRAGQPLRITDVGMTRFMISLDQGVSLVERAFSDGAGGEIFVRKIPSMRVVDIAEAVDPGGLREFIGVRPGEKIHEQMVGEEDAHKSWEFDDHFRIASEVEPETKEKMEAIGGTQVEEGFSYRSDTNSDWMSIEYLRGWIEENQSSMLRV